METFKITNFDLYDIVLYGDAEEKQTLLENEVFLEGWVRTNRDNGQIGFIEFNDGTYFKNVQLVYNKENKDYEVLTALRNGCAIEVSGKVKLTPEMKQPFEIEVTGATLVGDCADDYGHQPRWLSRDCQGRLQPRLPAGEENGNRRSGEGLR